jgi:hypothetical protein
VRQLEWWIVRVVTPPDQPWSGFDKGKVTVVVERAINLVGRLADVQPLPRIDFRVGPKTRLENTSCDVVTGADPGCEDQDSSTPERMLGPPATNVSPGHSRISSVFQRSTDMPENRPAPYRRTLYRRLPVAGQHGE